MLLRARAAGDDAPLRHAAHEVLPGLFGELGLPALELQHLVVRRDPAERAIEGGVRNPAGAGAGPKRVEEGVERRLGVGRHRCGRDAAGDEQQPGATRRLEHGHAVAPLVGLGRHPPR